MSYTNSKAFAGLSGECFIFQIEKNKSSNACLHMSEHVRKPQSEWPPDWSCGPVDDVVPCPGTGFEPDDRLKLEDVVLCKACSFAHTYVFVNPEMFLKYRPLRDLTPDERERQKSLLHQNARRIAANCSEGKQQ